MNSLPEGLIDVWEDFNFIKQCNGIWSFGVPSSEAKESHNYSEILSQASPQLSRILQAYRLTFNHHNRYFRVRDRYFQVRDCDFLLNIRILLNLPWDELRRAICPLREIIGDDDRGIWALLDLTSDPAPPRTPHCGSILWDITFGYLSVVRAVNVRRLPANFGKVSFNATDMRS
jgi:hypothetical protein